MVTPFCYPYLVKLFICHPDTKYFWLKVSMFETRNAVRCECVRLLLCVCVCVVCTCARTYERMYVASLAVCATGFFARASMRANVCVLMCVIFVQRETYYYTHVDMRSAHQLNHIHSNFID